MDSQDSRSADDVAPAPATEDTPLLQGDTGESTTHRTDEEQATTDGSETQLHRPGRIFVIGHWVSAIDGVVILTLLLAIYVAYKFSPSRYHLSYDFRESIPSTLAMVLNSLCLLPNALADSFSQDLISIAWSASNLVRLRRSGTLLPLGLGAIIHGCLGFFLTAVSASTIDDFLSGYSSCSVYGDDPGEEYWPCLAWKTKFHILLGFYLGTVLLLG
jgi:hypothetical protein